MFAIIVNHHIFQKLFDFCDKLITVFVISDYFCSTSTPSETFITTIEIHAIIDYVHPVSFSKDYIYIYIFQQSTITDSSHYAQVITMTFQVKVQVHINSKKYNMRLFCIVFRFNIYSWLLQSGCYYSVK